jgi:hypothetical protein
MQRTAYGTGRTVAIFRPSRGKRTSTLPCLRAVVEPKRPLYRSGHNDRNWPAADRLLTSSQAFESDFNVDALYEQLTAAHE